MEKGGPKKPSESLRGGLGASASQMTRKQRRLLEEEGKNEACSATTFYNSPVPIGNWGGARDRVWTAGASPLNNVLAPSGGTLVFPCLPSL